MGSASLPLVLHGTGVSTHDTQEMLPQKTGSKFNHQKRKSHADSLRKKPKQKTLSQKALNNSFREKYLTGNKKKKLATNQEEPGGESDYILIMKNNIQKPSKQTKTAGKFMFLGKEHLAEKFMGKGVKFDKKSFVKLANC